MIRAIQTSYRGYRFRSRLEARWAVFFDQFGMKWEYEKEGFELSSGCYLPDFWIPLQGRYAGPHPKGYPPIKGFWVEIKPCLLTATERRLCQELSAASGHVVYAAAGNIGDGHCLKWHPKTGDCRESPCNGRESIPHGLLFYLVAEAVPDHYQYFFDRIPVAFEAARSARFEFGETSR